MMRRWVGAAVIAGCLGLVHAEARAQYPPGPAGSSPLPEPLSFGQGGAEAPGGPDLGAAPLTSPGGPVVSLPADGTGAFPCQEPCLESGTFFHVGGQALRRQGFGNEILAVRDPQNLDTGAAPTAGLPVLQKLGNVNPLFNGGVRATLGCLFEGNQSLEITGFYDFEGTQSNSISNAGRIDSFFTNIPLGFEGDNGLWLQADRQTTALKTILWGTEVNYRWADPGLMGAELIVGVRYLDLKDKITTTTDDDGIAFPLTNGQPDPTRVASYAVQTENRYFGPQLGFEWGRDCCKWMTLGVGGKGSVGADYVELRRTLMRGDGFVGFDAGKDRFQYSMLYELNGFVDFHLLERVKLRLGYQALWFVHMDNVSGEYDFNLQNTNGSNSQSGSVFFHGPMAELQFFF